VTQQINLTDNTVKGNIAFGIPYEDIDDEKVRSAAEMAAVAEFVEHLPEGYDTHVGENGVRFSGGQKQRIALARALYLDRPVLILDEATSALDTETEGGILKALLDMDQDKTIIIITHRKETLENVDQIIDLDKHVSSS
jgi:ABC-type multidrug transport system fused ATPase/permease subunit